MRRRSSGGKSGWSICIADIRSRIFRNQELCFKVITFIGDTLENVDCLSNNATNDIL